MDNNYVKNSFESIGVSKSRVLRRVRDGIADKSKTRRVPKARAAIVCCLAVIVVGTATASIPGTSTFAQDVLRSWGLTIIGGNTSWEAGSEYVELPSTKESMTDTWFSSIGDIEKIIGVDILESSDAYTGADRMYEYIPGVEDGKLYSATIMNNAYAIGDLKDFRVERDKRHDFPRTLYEPGERYQSAINLEFTVRGVREDGTESTDFEKMDHWDLTDEGVELIKYKPAQIDVEVALYTITREQMLKGLLADIADGKEPDVLAEELDTLAKGETPEGEPQQPPVAIAQFVYNDVSYLYSAFMPIDDMKAFLDTLALE
jgi:hypothetical protein